MSGYLESPDDVRMRLATENNRAMQGSNVVPDRLVHLSVVTAVRDKKLTSGPSSLTHMG